MMRNVVAACIVTAIAHAGPVGAAQSDGAALDVPAVPGGWVVRVTTRGGIMGQGAPDIVVVSDGRLSCDGPKSRCAPAVPRAALQSLADQIQRAPMEAWPVFPRTTICSDCQTTTMLLTRRNADGTVTMTSATWDPITRAKLPPEVARIRDLAAQIAQPLTR